MGDAAKIAELEAKVAKLEVEVSEKDAVIKRLSGGAAAAAPSGAAPPLPAPVTSDEAKELLCYDDDASLGATAPSLAGLKFQNGDAFDVGGGKPTVITWFCNLNKADFVTLSELTDVYNKYVGKVNFVAISRDHEEENVAKWLKKYNGVFMAEQKGARGEAGATIKCDFQMAYDPEHKVNAAYKTALKKAVVGVGSVTIVDKDGKVAWNETFVRGANPTGQFEYQLHAIINGTEMIKNGNAPEVVEEEVEGGGTVPDDLDFLATGGGDY